MLKNKLSAAVILAAMCWVQVVFAVNNSVDIAPMGDGDIAAAIGNLKNGDTLTMMGSYANPYQFNINVPAGITVVWTAQASKININVSGEGKFEVASGSSSGVVNNTTTSAAVTQETPVVASDAPVVAEAEKISRTKILTPHFTDSSMKIVMPKEGAVSPEIHDGMIAVHKYPQQMFVNAKTGKYVFGTDFYFTRGNDRNSAYFSGGAMVAFRKTDNGSVMCILYPDGKYRDFPTGTKTSSGLSNDITAITSFLDGYAVVRRGNMMFSTQSFIDKNGKAVFPALTSKVKGTMGDMNIYPVKENRRLYYNAELEKYGYADAKGTIVIKPQFLAAHNFSEGLAAVMIMENSVKKWGFINTTGKMVVPATYRLEPGKFSEGLAPVRIGESDSDYEMAYIDKTGKRMMENKAWNLNEFHNGFAWVGTGCDKLFIMDKEFKEVRDVTKDFYHNGNGFGVCSFKMKKDLPYGKQGGAWGVDFPDSMQMLNQGGIDEGDIFAPNGEILYTAKDAAGGRVNLHYTPGNDLFFCQVRFNDEPRLKEKSVLLPCFINKEGEIVYYFEEGFEGYEGTKPVQVK